MKLAKLSDRPEVFLSVQGEGPSAGTPSVFVRCSLCNLYCAWCDTDYTWNWIDTAYSHARDTQAGYRKYRPQDEIIDVPVPDLVELIGGYQCRNVVLTGGEPLIQQRELEQLMECLRAADSHYSFEVETNGTLLPEPGFHRHVQQYSVSVKLANSNVPARLRKKRQAVEFFVREGAYFKFVIESEQDIDEVETLVAGYSIPVSSVYLMPEGRESGVLRQRALWLVEICNQRGFRFSDRLHIHLFGEARGR